MVIRVLLTVVLLVGCASGQDRVDAEPSPKVSAGAPRDPAYVVARLTIGAKPCGVETDGTAVWVSTFGSSALHRIDPATDAVTDVVPVGASPCGLGHGAGSIWTSDFRGDSVTRVDTASRRVVATISVGSQPYDAAFGAGSAWVTNYADGTVSRISPDTNTVVATIEVGPGPAGVAVVGSSAWVGLSDGTMARIDVATNRVRQHAEAGTTRATWLSHSASALWTALPDAGELVQLDPRDGRVMRRIDAAGTPADGDVVAGDVWVPLRGGRPGGVVRVDTATGEAVAVPLPLLDGFVLAGAAGDVWVPDFGGTDVLRVRPSLAPPAGSPDGPG